MRIDGHGLKVTDSEIIYRGKRYPLKGARASSTTSVRRQGVPLLTRRTIRTTTLTIQGPGFYITGDVYASGVRGTARRVRRLVEQVNGQ